MKILFLSDCQNLIPDLAEIYISQWPECYRRGNLQSAIEELQSSLSNYKLPITLVAIEGVKYLGSVSLVTSDIPIYSNLGPWITTLYVPPSERYHGIACKLLKKGLECLMELDEIYAYIWLEKNLAVYKKWGWELTKTIRYRNKISYIMKGEIAKILADNKTFTHY